MNTEPHYLKKELDKLIQEDLSAFEFFQNGSLDGIWYWDLENPENEWLSPRFWETLGYDPEGKKHLASEWQDLIHPEDLKVSLENFRKHCADPDHPYDQIVRYRHRDGSTVSVRCRGIAIRDKTGRPIRMLGAHTDLTPQITAEKALRDLYETMDLAQKMAGIGYWRYDKKSGERTWSEQMFISFGFDPELPPPSNEQLRERFIPEDGDRYTRAFRGVLEGTPYDMVVQLHLPGGRTRYLHTQGYPRYDEEGDIIGSFGTSQDITGRKLVEIGLRESEEKYRRIFENSVVGFFESTPEGRFISVNPAFADMLGYRSPDDLVSSISDISTQYYANPDDRRRYQQRLKETGTVEDFEFRALRKDGSPIWVSNYTRAYFGEDGEVVRYEGIVSDITERKQAELALVASERKFKDILFNIPQIGIALDIQARIVFANTHFLELTGWKEQEIIGRDWFDMFIPETLREEVRKVFNDVMAQKDTLGFSPYENEIMTRSGELRNVAWSNVLTKDAQGKVIDVTCFGIDITERIRAEEERENLQTRLMQAQKMESIGRLAGGVAHDFNNMLGVILGNTEMAMDQIDSFHPLYTGLREIRKAGERSVELTRQLLGFARKQTISPEILDMNETVDGMLKMLRRLIGEDIDLVWLPGDGLWRIKMDPAQVDQILANLMVNARDAITGTGRVTIKTENVTLDEAYCRDHPGAIPGDYVGLTVSDDGCGMDKKIQDKIFEPFFTTKDMGRGTGLGLSTIYGIVKQNDGFITVDSRPQQGSTFRIFFSPYTGKSPRIQKSASEAPFSRGQETILLVEDEHAILKMTERMLQKLGYSVLPAATPGEAIRLAETHAGEIHLLMTDVVMPEMNGRDLARRLMSLYPDMMCLFMSGYTADIIAHRGVIDKGMHFIQKPFTQKDLSATLRRVLDEANVAPEPPEPRGPGI